MANTVTQEILLQIKGDTSSAVASLKALASESLADAAALKSSVSGAQAAITDATKALKAELADINTTIKAMNAQYKSNAADMVADTNKITAATKQAQAIFDQYAASSVKIATLGNALKAQVNSWTELGSKIKATETDLQSYQNELARTLSSKGVFPQNTPYNPNTMNQQALQQNPSMAGLTPASLKDVITQLDTISETESKITNLENQQDLAAQKQAPLLQQMSAEVQKRVVLENQINTAGGTQAGLAASLSANAVKDLDQKKTEQAGINAQVAEEAKQQQLVLAALVQQDQKQQQLNAVMQQVAALREKASAATTVATNFQIDQNQIKAQGQQAGKLFSVAMLAAIVGGLAGGPIGAALAAVLVPAFATLFSNGPQILSSVIQFGAKIASNLANSIASGLTGLSSLLGNVFSGALGTVLTTITSGLASIVSAVGGVFSGIANTIGQAVASAMSFITGFVQGVSQAFGQVGQVLGKVGQQFMQLTNTIMQWATSAGEEANAIRSLSLGLGTTIEQASGLNGVFEILGGRSNFLVGAMDSIVKAAGANNQAFVNLGVATRDSNGHLLDTVTILSNLGQAYTDATDKQEALSQLTQLFGPRMAAAFLPLLGLGQQLPAVIAEMHNLGLVMSDDMVHAGENLRVDMFSVSQAVDMVKNSFVTALEPAITHFVSLLVSALPAIENFATEVGRAFNNLLQGLLSVFGQVNPLIQQVLAAFNIFGVAGSKAVNDSGAAVTANKAAVTAGKEALQGYTDAAAAEENSLKAVNDQIKEVQASYTAMLQGTTDQPGPEVQLQNEQNALAQVQQAWTNLKQPIQDHIADLQNEKQAAQDAVDAEVQPLDDLKSKLQDTLDIAKQQETEALTPLQTVSDQLKMSLDDLNEQEREALSGLQEQALVIQSAIDRLNAALAPSNAQIALLQGQLDDAQSKADQLQATQDTTASTTDTTAADTTAGGGVPGSLSGVVPPAPPIQVAAGAFEEYSSAASSAAESTLANTDATKDQITVLQDQLKTLNDTIALQQQEQTIQDALGISALGAAEMQKKQLENQDTLIAAQKRAAGETVAEYENKLKIASLDINITNMQQQRTVDNARNKAEQDRQKEALQDQITALQQMATLNAQVTAQIKAQATASSDFYKVQQDDQKVSDEFLAKIAADQLKATEKQTSVDASANKAAIADTNKLAEERAKQAKEAAEAATKADKAKIDSINAQIKGIEATQAPLKSKLALEQGSLNVNKSQQAIITDTYAIKKFPIEDALAGVGAKITHIQDQFQITNGGLIANIALLGAQASIIKDKAAPGIEAISSQINTSQRQLNVLARQYQPIVDNYNESITTLKGTVDGIKQAEQQAIAPLQNEADALNTAIQGIQENANNARDDLQQMEDAAKKAATAIVGANQAALPTNQNNNPRQNQYGLNPDAMYDQSSAPKNLFGVDWYALGQKAMAAIQEAIKHPQQAWDDLWNALETDWLPTITKIAGDIGGTFVKGIGDIWSFLTKPQSSGVDMNQTDFQAVVGPSYFDQFTTFLKTGIEKALDAVDWDKVIGTAIGSTLKGSFEAFAQFSAWTDLVIGYLIYLLGLEIIKGTEKIAELGKDIVVGIYNGLKKFAESVFSDIGSFLWDVITKPIKSFWGMASPSKKAADELGGPIIEGMLEGMKTALADVLTWLGTLDNTILHTIGDTSKWLTDKGHDVITGLWNGFKDIWGDEKVGIGTILGWIGGWKDDLLTAIGDATKWLSNKGNDIIGSLWDGLKAIWGAEGATGNTVLGWFGNFKTDLLSAIGDAAKWLSQKGTDILTGLWNGMKDLWGDTKSGAGTVMGWFGGFEKDIQNAFSDADTWLKDAGGKIIDGLMSGISAANDKAKNVPIIGPILGAAEDAPGWALGKVQGKALGGIVGLSGPELAVLGEGGGPELVVNARQTAALQAAGMIQGGQLNIPTMPGTGNGIVSSGGRQYTINNVNNFAAAPRSRTAEDAAANQALTKLITSARYGY